MAASKNKMIEVTIRFWTDAIAPEQGEILPKHAWDGGTVRVKPNELHRISGVRQQTFNGLHDLPRALESTLREAGVVTHLPTRRRGADGPRFVVGR